MEILYLDIETTGLDPETCQILEVAAVLDDASTAKDVPVQDLPYRHWRILHKELAGHPTALAMNEAHIRDMSDILRSGETAPEGWVHARFDLPTLLNGLVALSRNKSSYFVPRRLKVVAGGKNVLSFDVPFLRKRYPNMDDLFDFHYASVDPSVLLVDWEKDDRLPSLAECMKRVGIDRPQAHTALQDARDVCEVTRRATYNYTRRFFL